MVSQQRPRRGARGGAPDGASLRPARVALLALSLLLGCARERPLADRPCPCAESEGFACCETTGRCLPRGAVCPAAPPDAPGPTVDGSGDLPEDPVADAGAAGADGAPTVDASGACLGPVHDGCEEVPPLASPPVIDGALECGLALRPIVPQGWTHPGPVPPDRAAAYAVAWRPEGLYVYVSVDTPDRRPSVGASGRLHCGDAVEIFVDADGAFTRPPAYDPEGTMQFVIPAPAAVDHRLGWRWIRGVELGGWDGRFVASPRPGGYAVEAFIQAADLGLRTWTLGAGDRVGIDLAIDLSGQGGEPDCSRLGQFSLRVAPPTAGCPGYPWCSVAAFCRPQLVPAR
jgi:hypothetical protein